MLWALWEVRRDSPWLWAESDSVGTSRGVVVGQGVDEEGRAVSARREPSVDGFYCGQEVEPRRA